MSVLLLAVYKKKIENSCSLISRLKEYERFAFQVDIKTSQK